MKLEWIDVLIIALFIISVYLVLDYLFGHSPSSIEVTVGLFTFLGGLLYKLNREFGKFKTWTRMQIQLIKDDTKTIKEDIEKIKKILVKISEK